MIRKEEVFKIGQFAKPHGVKGEISLVTNYKDLFDSVEDPYVVCETDGILVPFFVEEYRDKTNTVMLVKLERVDNDESIREFMGREVFFPLKEVGDEIPADYLSWSDLVGYTLEDERHNELGKITDVDDTTVNVLLQIFHNGKEVLLPAVEELVLSLDHKNKILQVSVPEGLLNL